MINRIFPVGAALALLLGTMVGCSDSAVDANSSSTPGADPYAMYSVDQTAMSDFSEVPSVNEVFAKEGDPARGRGDKENRDHGWGKLELRSYRNILKQLNLTDEQKAAIKICFDEYRDCVKGDAERYRNARQEKHDALKSALARIRAAVEDGSMTAEDGRALAKQLTQTYRNEIETLNAAFKAAIAECRDALHRCIRGHLTEEQIAIWDRLNG